MSFCTKCGKQLADGEVCGCDNQQAAPQAASQQVAPQAEQPVQAAVKANNPMPDFIEDVITFFKKAFKKPADAVSEFVAKGNIIASLIILAVCGVITMVTDILYKVIYNVRIENDYKENFNLWDTSTWDVDPVYSGSEIALGAFGDLFYTFASAAVIAGVMYVMIKFVFEKDSDVKFGQLFAIMALVELVQLPFSFVYTIFSYFGVAFITRFGGWISSFGGALGTVTLFVGLKDRVKSYNNMFLVYAVAVVANSIMYTLLDVIGML